MLEDSEIEAREEDVSEKQKHQLKHSKSLTKFIT
jgi:hypothetical protein